MNEMTTSKIPAYYWIVTLLSLIWNGFGCYDYIMTRTRNLEYLSQMGDAAAMLQWIDSFPLWAQILWPVGVWTSLIGSLLLLGRSRHAPLAFLVSFVAALGSMSYQFLVPPPAAIDTDANRVMGLVILVIILLLWWFSRHALRRAWLR